jgi:hypothetical protein
MSRYDDLIAKAREEKLETETREPLFVRGLRAVLPVSAEQFIGIPPKPIEFKPPPPPPPNLGRYADLLPQPEKEAPILPITIPLSPLVSTTTPAMPEQPIIKQAPPKTGFEKFKEVISKPFVQTLEERVAKDQAVFALHKSLNERYYEELGRQIGLDPKEARSRIDELSTTLGVPKEQFSMDQVRENFDKITKELGLRQIPTTEELITDLFYVPIVAGLLTNPISTVVGLGAFTALTETESFIISKIRQKPYLFGEGQNVSDLLPDEINDLTKDTVEILDFLAKAKALHVTYKKTPEVIRAFTKTAVTTYNLPRTVFIEGEKIKSIFQTGEKISPEELKLIQELGLTGQQYKDAIKNGASVEVPLEKVVTLTDKPYWAKFKQILRLQPTEAEIRVTRPEAIKQAPLGLLEVGKPPTVPVTTIPVAPEAPKPAITPKPALEVKPTFRLPAEEAKDLVESRTREEIDSKLDRIFGTLKELDALEAKDEPTRFERKKLAIADEFRADIERAAIDRELDEATSLMGRALAEIDKLKKAITPVVAKPKPEVAPPTGKIEIKTKAPALKRVFPSGYILTQDSFGNEFVQIKGELPENIKAKIEPNARREDASKMKLEQLAEGAETPATPVEIGPQKDQPRVELVRFRTQDGGDIYINKEYLNLALRSFPKAEFLTGGKLGFLVLVDKGEVVGVISPIKDVTIAKPLAPEAGVAERKTRFQDLIPKKPEAEVKPVEAKPISRIKAKEVPPEKIEPKKKEEEIRGKEREGVITDLTFELTDAGVEVKTAAKLVDEAVRAKTFEEFNESPTMNTLAPFDRNLLATELGGAREFFNRVKETLKISEELPIEELEGTTLAAGIGAFREGEPIKFGRIDDIRPIEFPELVELATELMDTPEVVRRFRKPGRLGVFRGEKGITLSGALFKKGNEIQLARALAHEIGHLVDYLPDRTLKRGNLLGRLESLIKFGKATFTTEDGKEIRNKDIRKELKTVSLFWRPPVVMERMIDAETGVEKLVPREVPLEETSKSFQQYRNSGKELYADAISMLFNNPGLLQEMAPTFYREFFAALDNKAEVKEAYFGLQEVLSGSREELVARRRAGVRRMFETADYKAEELQKLKEEEKKQTRKDLVLKLKTQFLTKNQKVIDNIRELEKRGVVIPEDENPLFFLEERNYIGGLVTGFTKRTFGPVYEATQEANIDWADFGESLLYERIIAGDRSELANPRGITPDVAKELYDDLKTKLGPEKAKILQEQIEAFRKPIKEVADKAFEAGLYTEELHKQMQENPAYVTFQVIEHLEDGVTSRVYKQIGTLKEVRSPADASILKTLVTLRAIEHQKMKVSVFDHLTKNFPDQIEDAKEIWTGKGRKPIESKDPKQKLITYYKEGKLKGKYVDPYIAGSIENESIGRNLAGLGVLRWLNTRLFKPLFTGFNLGFQTFNIFRDFLRFWKNTPGMTLWRASKRYIQALPVAKARAFGIDKSSPEVAEFLRQAEEAKILSVTFNDYILGRNVGEKQIEEILARVGVGDFKLEPTKWYAKPFMPVLEFIKQTGDLIETLPKVAAIYEFKGEGTIADISPAQRSFIRRKIGSPDFLDGGTAKPITNEVFLYSTAIIQAIRADIEVAVEPKTRSGFWWKTIKQNLIPKVLMYGALLGVFGETVRRIMQSASEYDRTNYTIIPLGEDDKGNGIYFRLPQDDSGRFIGGLFWKGLQIARGDAEAAKTFQQVFDYTAGQLPSMSPPIGAVFSTTQFLAGQNPYDFFRGRNVLTEDEFKAADSRAIKKFLGWEFQQLGGGVVWKFYAGEQTPREQTTGQKILQFPILSNIIGRFIKISNYGQVEDLRSQIAETQKEEARQRLDERSAVFDAIREYMDLLPEDQKPATIRNQAKQIVDELYPDEKKDEQNRKKNLIEKKIKLGIARGGADPIVDALFSATSNDQKLSVLLRVKETMSEQDFKKFLNEANKEGIISDDVEKEAKRF